MFNSTGDLHVSSVVSIRKLLKKQRYVHVDMYLCSKSSSNLAEIKLTLSEIYHLFYSENVKTTA